MKRLKTGLQALVFLSLATPVAAADFADPTWPCIQRKVARLSVGLMWPVPIDPEFEPSAELRPEIDALAESLSLRRIDLTELEPDVAAFAQSVDGDAQLLGLVFAEVFNALSNRRTRIIEGIEDFSLGQIALSEKIDMARVEMDAIMAKAEPDFDRVDQLEEQLDWDQVIYSDRQKSITYLCETPVLLEKRLFEVARMLQMNLSD
ncbi:hypothetical protein EDD52_10554 [Primorskyibacter sedentarius]|uniref:Uncharacterized protein n=1 Tax=Primorskyibacter sedentarius TaxID=745311 RepID=A0A4R3JF82_9RHOB|nr:hypothetical protein [Primorskyibacter sedentarius]TCS64494.1 hypothetical protein EDD52_10554 [Primorskyibacter sedentarius]